jgi:hypothetical protein
MMATPPIFSPMCTQPFTFDVAARVRRLRELLLDKSYEHQKENILLAIQMYETGQLPKKEGMLRTWFVNGKVVDYPFRLTEGMTVWVEVGHISLIHAIAFTYLFFRVSPCSLCRPLRHRR